MNEQFVFRVSDDSQFTPLERLPRKRNQSTDFVLSGRGFRSTASREKPIRCWKWSRTE